MNPLNSFREAIDASGVYLVLALAVCGLATCIYILRRTLDNIEQREQEREAFSIFEAIFSDLIALAFIVFIPYFLLMVIGDSSDIEPTVVVSSLTPVSVEAPVPERDWVKMIAQFLQTMRKN